jgi:hypothetical protein
VALPIRLHIADPARGPGLGLPGGTVALYATEPGSIPGGSNHFSRRLAARNSTFLAHVTGLSPSASAAALISSRSASVSGNPK